MCLLVFGNKILSKFVNRVFIYLFATAVYSFRAWVGGRMGEAFKNGIFIWQEKLSPQNQCSMWGFPQVSFLDLGCMGLWWFTFIVSLTRLQSPRRHTSRCVCDDVCREV